MSDGASINHCITEKCNLEQEMCLAHAIQLAIKVSLYDNNYVIDDDDCCLTESTSGMTSMAIDQRTL